MIKTAACFVLLTLTFQDDPVATAALKGYKHPWADFGEGSTVKYRETILQPDIDNSGKLVNRPIVSEVIWTVTGIEGQKTILRIEGSGGQESTIPHFVGLPSWARGKGEARGDEEVAVGDRKVKCQVTAITLDSDKDAAQVTTISRSAEVPYWAVRRRVETLIRGKANTWEEDRLVAVEERVQAGGKDLLCVVVETTTEAAGGVKTVRKEWRSDQVPGRVVRRQTRTFRNDKEIVSAATQMEVVTFTSKR